MSPPGSAASVEQQALLLLEQLRGPSARVVVLEAEGDLEPAIVERAWRGLIERHAALRSCFGTRTSVPVCEVRAPDAAEDAVLDIVEPGDPAARSRAVEHAAAIRLDATSWPLCRATLVRFRGGVVIVMAFHPATLDQPSAGIAARDLLALYHALLTDQPSALPAVPSPRESFCATEQRAMRDLWARAQAHWEPTFSAIADSLRIPVRPAEENGVPEPCSGPRQALEPGLSRRLAAVAAAHGVSLYAWLLAAVQTLQYRYAGSGDEGVATALTANCRSREARDTIGLFSNELPLYSAPKDDTAFVAFASDVQRRSGDLFRLKRFPITRALAQFGGGARASDAMAQVAFSYERAHALPRLPDLRILSCETRTPTLTSRPLGVSFVDDRSELTFRLDYDARVMTAEAAGSMSSRLHSLLESVADHADAQLGGLSLLVGGERDRILGQWGTGRMTDAPAVPVSALVEDAVARDPHAAAVVLGSATLSYAELNAQANRLAHHLRAIGAGPGVLVAICLERSLDLVVGMVAILKAGAAYVPLDPNHPVERLQTMVDDARPQLLLSRQHLNGRLPVTRGRLVLLDRDARAIAAASHRNPPPATADSLVYVIYTSGSTGRPKGVAMRHRSACNLLAWQRSRFRTAGPARTLQFASAGFDVAFQEIFSTLMTGGTLHLIPEDLRGDFDHLATIIDEQRLDRLFLPPLALREIARRLPLDRVDLRPVEVITAGERLEISTQVRRLFQVRRNWTLDNQYGPTETHVATAQRLDEHPDDWPTLPSIGRPIDNVRVRILDRRGALVPAGVPGQLCIAGICVAQGYLHDPKLSSERFLEDPFVEQAMPLYLTGDVARWAHDGTVEFLGRLDDQVKIRGYRIEPAEVASALARHVKVAHAAVTPYAGAGGDKRLVAYVVAREGQLPAPRELRSFLSGLLPDFMVPAAFVTIDRLPLTANGKLDRRALPAPSPDTATHGRFVPPAGPTQQGVAELWAELLGLERVGADDDFFELGGHSLLAAEAVARARRRFDVALPLRTLFAGPTVAQLASAIDAALSTGQVTLQIPRAHRQRLSD